MEKTPMLHLVKWLENQIKIFSDRSHPDYNVSRSVSFILIKRKIVGSFLREEKNFIEQILFDGATTLNQEEFEYFIDDFSPTDTEAVEDLSIADYYNWLRNEASSYSIDLYKNSLYFNKVLNMEDKIKKIWPNSEPIKNERLLLEFKENKKE